MDERLPGPSRGRVLCAILASPPLTAGVRTRNMVGTAAALLGCDQVLVVNLLNAPTADIPAMSVSGREAEAWLESRSALSAGLAQADELLAAWGKQGLTGPARTHRQDQLAWLGAEASVCGHLTAWAVGAEPRHPSRWHQYVSDRHGRTSGAGTTSQRIAEVLAQHSLGCLTSQRPTAAAVPRQCSYRACVSASPGGESAPFVGATH